MASMAQPDPPLPPADFATRALPIETIDAAATFVRIHLTAFEALHFGRTGRNRFDDPKRSFGVCYLSRSLEGAFAETCLRAVGAQFVALSFLQARSVTTLAASRPLRLVAVHGAGLAAIGTTSAVSGGDHALAQAWAWAIHEHPDAPDGLIYRANHDNGELCVALFDRASAALGPAGVEPLVADRRRLGLLLARYGVGLG
jgi:hypothetical protein